MRRRWAFSEIGELTLSLSQSVAKTAKAAATVAEVVARINSVDNQPTIDLKPAEKSLRAERQRQLALARTKENLNRQIEELQRELAELHRKLARNGWIGLHCFNR